MHPFVEQLRQMPFVRLAIALISGIIIQSSFGFNFSTLPIAIGLTVVFLLLFFVRAVNTYTRQWISGSVGLLCLFFIGTTITQQQPLKTSLPLGEDLFLQGEICDWPLSYPSYTKLFVNVKTYATSGDTVVADEKIILYVSSDSTTKIPQVGATIYTKANLSVIPPPGNPEEFNYQQFLARQEIFASAFIRQGDYVFNNDLSFWKKLKYQPLEWQQSGLRAFANSPLGDRECAVMVSLTLGNKQLLDDEIRASYIAVGAMHILVVSGMHVGLIMIILNFVLSFLSKYKRGVIFKNCLIILCLWLYTAIVGFSPSVLRAAVMFSFMIAGQTLQRQISMYNSLALSAFFICLFDPYVLFDAGFQLSYCAVFSIVYFEPYLSKMLYVKNKILKGIWQLAVVSVAAQIGTLPISLMSFHLFPNYFLLTNVSVITLSGYITYGGALYLAVSVIPGVSTVVGYVLNILVWLLNFTIQYVESLPYSVTKNIYLYDWQAILLIALISFWALYIAFPRRVWKWAMAYAFVFIIGGFSLQMIEQREQKMTVVYKVKNATYIQFINGANCFTVRDEAHANTNYSFNVDNFRIKHGIALTKEYFEPSVLQGDTVINGTICYHGLIIFENQTYKILENETIDKRLPSLPTDYLLVTGRARMNPEIALQRYFPKQIIIDNSVPNYRIQQWIAAAESQGIPVYNVRERGAWINSFQ